MSEFNLTVGECYEQRRTTRCMSHLQGLGMRTDDSLFKSQDRQSKKTFLLLNIATMGIFLNYVAQLVARPSEELADDLAFINLPYWQDSLWMPLDFARPARFEDDEDGPFFFGSSLRLLATLDFIKSISRIPLGPAPPGYDLMVSDLRAFYKNFQGLEDEQSCIQWVWRGLHDGATLAIQSKSPMLGNGL